MKGLIITGTDVALTNPKLANADTEKAIAFMEAHEVAHQVR